MRVPANQVLAVSNIDFYTAAHILAEDLNHNIGKTSPPVEIKEYDTILFQNWPLLSCLRENLGGGVIAIVCMPEAIADLLQIPVLDKITKANTLPKLKFETLWDMQDARPNKIGLSIPLVNVDEMLILNQIETLKREQIMSHVLTFIYNVPPSSREEVQRGLLQWLAGDISTDRFCAMYQNRWNKAAGSLVLLRNFMDSKRGKEYVEFFKRCLKGQVTQKTDIPSFEIAYFTKLREKLADSKK